MKIILSRKGFDSSNGGIPSPIMPDGTLLSMPIMEKEGVSYSDIVWNGITYADILKQLSPTKTFDRCHVDPDIRENRKKFIKGWVPAFGQCDTAQTQLENAGVEKGDIFLFFGWFHRVEETPDGYRFKRNNPDDFYSGSDLHILYGYMEVGEIIKDQECIKKFYWHPHSSDSHTSKKKNALYLPSKSLSIIPSKKGYGTLEYRQDRVLTMKGMSRAVWNEYKFLMPEHIRENRKNSAKEKGLYYAGQWQETVVYESAGLRDWVKKVIT
ncbi:MAG: hypothetical protein K6E47_03120 [Lachnospiraceae bacterium]|nr:hypothetical protein [Lachnospiraceae bacterium]